MSYNDVMANYEDTTAPRTNYMRDVVKGFSHEEAKTEAPIMMCEMLERIAIKLEGRCND